MSALISSPDSRGDVSQQELNNQASKRATRKKHGSVYV